MRRLSTLALSIGFVVTGLLGAAFAQPNPGAQSVGFGHFQPNFGGTQAISGTTTSASVTLTTADLQNPELRIYNSGTVAVFCRWGIGAQTALTSDIAIAPGATQLYTKGTVVAGQGQTQAVACITASGTATVYVITGVGGWGAQ